MPSCVLDVPEAGSSKLWVTKCVAEVVQVGLSAFIGTEYAPSP